MSSVRAQHWRATHTRARGGRMNVDDVEDLSLLEPISFKNKVDIQLLDQDAGYTGGDEDDLLGRFTVQAFQAGVARAP